MFVLEFLVINPAASSILDAPHSPPPRYNQFQDKNGNWKYVDVLRDTQCKVGHMVHPNVLHDLGFTPFDVYVNVNDAINILLPNGQKDTTFGTIMLRWMDLSGDERYEVFHVYNLFDGKLGSIVLIGSEGRSGKDRPIVGAIYPAGPTTPEERKEMERRLAEVEWTANQRYGRSYGGLHTAAPSVPSQSSNPSWSSERPAAVGMSQSQPAQVQQNYDTLPSSLTPSGGSKLSRFFKFL